MSTPAQLSGEWTIHAIAQHREAMLLLVNEGHTSFDASGISELDSAGLQLLLAVQRSVAKRGGELILTQCSRCLKDLLQVYGLDETLHSIHDLEAAS